MKGKTIHQIAQPQQKIPLPKGSQLDIILDELETSQVMEPVEDPTDWIFNLTLTPNTDPTQICMKVDMTTANTGIPCTRHVIPTLEELG